MNSKVKDYIVTMSVYGVKPFPVRYEKCELYMFDGTFGRNRSADSCLGYLNEARQFAAAKGHGGMNTITGDEWKLVKSLGKRLKKKFPRMEQCSPPVGAEEIKAMHRLYAPAGYFDDPYEHVKYLRILFQRLIAGRKEFSRKSCTSGVVVQEKGKWFALLDGWKSQMNRPGATLPFDFVGDMRLCFLQQIQDFHKRWLSESFTERLWRLQKAGLEEDLIQLPSSRFPDQRKKENGMWKEFQERCILLEFERRQGEEKFTSKSLRSGFVRDALRAGCTPEQIMLFTRHASMKSLRKYMRMGANQEDIIMGDTLVGRKIAGYGGRFGL